MKIYTRRGDQGRTSLASGRRVMKNNELIEAYGTVDELNSFVGFLSAMAGEVDISGELRRIQHRLFNIGSILARDSFEMDNYPEITNRDITFLENIIDRHAESLHPLRNFILPAGSTTITLCHICRTITRRAERRIVSIQDKIQNKEVIVAYLNRLSDYFFILARLFASLEGIEEVIWESGFDADTSE